MFFTSPTILRLEQSLKKAPFDFEQLNQIKLQWIATVDAIVDPLMIVNVDYRVEKLNKALAKQVKGDIKDLLGKPCYQIFAGRDDVCEGCRLREFYDKQAHGMFQMKKGETIYEVSSQPIRQDDGSISGFVHIYRDRTEEKALQQKLIDLSYKILG